MKNNSIHKYVLRIIDHSMIYVAISGTYTPVLLHVVGGWIGWAVFTLLWEQPSGVFYTNQLRPVLILN